MPREAPCPTCRQSGPWLTGAHTPFCSERCRMVDLGKWLGEEHRITSPLTVEDLKELADLEEGAEEQADR